MDPNPTFTFTIWTDDYQLEDWYIAARDPQSITFRPSLKTLVMRLAITLVAAITVGVLATIREDLAGLGALPDGGDAVELVVNSGIWALMGLAALVGILSPLSTLWQRVTISRGVRGNLAVKSSRILRNTQEWPLDTFQSIRVMVQEQMGQTSKGRRYHRGYLWSVELGGQEGEDDQLCVKLQVDREKSAPLEGRLSERTRECVEALQEITGLPYDGSPVLIEDGLGPRIMRSSPEIMPGATPSMRGGGNVTQRVSTSSESHTYRSLDEMPPEVRARFEKMMARHGSSGVETHVSETITITDEHGNTRTYHSVDEMPPEIRARYEEARKKFRE